MNKFSYLTLCLLFSGLLISCHKQDPEPVADTEAPVITLVSPADPAQLVKGTLAIGASATDNKELSKIELYIDNQLMQTVLASPLEFSWNSKTTNDGVHDIKVVATDKEANASEVTIKLEVLNVFMAFKVDADFMTADADIKTYESWIVVSDNTGKSVGVSQVKAGETIKFATPEGFAKDKKYTFTRLSYKLSNDIGYGENPEYLLYSYADIGFGTYHLSLNASEKPRFIVGNSSVTINNYVQSGTPSGTTGFSGAGLGANSFSIVSSVLQANLNLFKEGAKVMFYQPDETTQSFRYKVMDNVVSNQHIVFDEADITDVMPVSSIALPVGTTFAASSIWSVDRKSAYDTKFLLLRGQEWNESEDIKVNYPAAAFPEYMTNISYGHDGASYFYSLWSETPPAIIKEITAKPLSMTVQDTKITLEISGEADMAVMNAYNYGEHETYVWSIYAPALTKGEWAIPQLPTELKAKYPTLGSQAFAFTEVTLEEYAGIEKYSDFIQLKFQSTDFFESKVRERMNISKSMTGNGGRREMKFIDLYHQGKR